LLAWLWEAVVDDFGAKLPVGGVAISGGLDPVRLHEVFANPTGARRLRQPDGSAS
jgi:hypothetical protein